MGKMLMKFRSEIPFGQGYRSLKDVMVHETYELGNSDILCTLLPKIKPADVKLANEISILINELEKNGFVDDFDENNWNKFFQKVIDTVNIISGKKYKYCLWLAEYDVVKNYYGKGELTKEEIDAYTESEMIISDIGFDGCLYAYEDLPYPVMYTDEDIKKSNERLHELTNTKP